jgi:hypothetical protein
LGWEKQLTEGRCRQVNATATRALVPRSTIRFLATAARAEERVNTEAAHHQDEDHGEKKFPKRSTGLVRAPLPHGGEASEGRQSQENRTGDFKPEPMKNPRRRAEEAPQMLKKK